MVESMECAMRYDELAPVLLDELQRQQ